MKRLIALAAVLILASCGLPSAPSAAPPTSTTASATNAAPPVPPPAAAPPMDDLQADFASFSAGIPAEVGLAVVAGPTSSTFGTRTAATAWSTIKVPLAIAALRADPDQAAAFVSAAISQSDNAAAESLWSLLGPPAQAAVAVQAVLAEGGDPTTSVQSVRVREGFTAFGQTDWPTEAQARFASRLPCIAGNEVVMADMQSLAGNQSWGLAGDADVAAKGGWGPGKDGGYLVRQLATISTPDGTIGIALAAEPEDGTFGSGVAAINQLADWIEANRDAFVPVPC